MTLRSLSIAFVVFMAPAAWPCCFSEETAFDFPRVPVEPYAASALHGVVLPDQALRHLALAWRSANGVPISELELAALVRAWGNTYATRNTADDVLEAREAWTRAASELLGAAPLNTGDGATPRSDYTVLENINAGAYRRALDRLSDRRKRYAKTPQLLAAFAWHQSKALGLEFPARADLTPAPDDARLFEAQQLFYGGKFDEATKAFDGLTGSSEGAWAAVSAARAQLRSSSIGNGGDAALAEAERRLGSIKSNDEAVSGAVRALTLRIHRVRRDFCGDLPRLMDKRVGDALPHLLVAFEDALDGYAGSDWEPVSPNCTQLPELRAWVTTFRALRVVGWGAGERTKEQLTAAKRALAQWSKTPTLPWLVAALTAADGTEPELAKLLEAAAAVAPGSLLGPTVSLHRARLLRLSSQREAGRALLAELPVAKWPMGTQNFFRLEQFFLAETAAEATQFAWPLPGKIVEGEHGWSGETAQVDGALTVNVLSEALDTRALLALAESSAPAEFRRLSAWAAFTRAAALQGDVVGAARALKTLEPKAPLEPIVSAKDAVSATGEALRFVMKHPGASVNVLTARDSGLKDTLGRQYDRSGCGSYRNGWDPGVVSGLRVPWAVPLSEAEQQLRVGGSGVAYPKLAVAFATAHPDHPLSPELLALAVAASKFHQGIAESGVAFKLLHSKWPRSKWASQTPIFW